MMRALIALVAAVVEVVVMAVAALLHMDVTVLVIVKVAVWGRWWWL